MPELNILDYIIIALLGWGIFSGFRRGLVMELTNIAGIFLGIWLAVKFSGNVSSWLETKYEVVGWWVPFFSFLLVFVGVYTVAFFSGKALSAAMKLMMLGMANRIGGAVFGFVKMLLFSGVVFLLFRSSGLSTLSPELEKGSIIHQKISSAANYLYPDFESRILGKTKEIPS